MNVVGGFLEILQTAKDQGLSLVIKVIKESDADDSERTT